MHPNIPFFIVFAIIISALAPRVIKDTITMWKEYFRKEM